MYDTHIIHILYVCKYFPSLSISYHNFVTTDLNEQEKNLEGNISKKQKERPMASTITDYCFLFTFLSILIPLNIYIIYNFIK